MSTKSKILILTAIVFCLPISADAGTIIRPVMNSGLVGYWNFQEGAGTTAYDKSGNRNHGALTNMDPSTDWTDGRLGGGLDFDGGDDEIDTNYNLTGEMTLSGWFNTKDNSGNQVIVGNNPYTGCDVHIYAGEVKYRQNASDGWDAIGYPITTNNWIHFSATYSNDSGIGILYVNGKRVAASSEMVAPSSADNFGIGGFPDNGYLNTFNGQIDEVRIYNRALSGEEIERLYNLTRPKIKAPTRDGLVGYWSMDEGMGTQVGDMSGNGNHSTMTNMNANTDWVAGRYGKALDFDGSDDYVAVSGLMGSPEDITISAWAKVDAIDTLGATIVSLGDHVAIIADAEWGTPSYTTSAVFYESGDTWPKTNSGESHVGTGWHHFTYTYKDNADEQKIYIDGVFKGESSHSASIEWSGLGLDTYFGKHGNGNADYTFNGKIDEVRIYNRALSASEIKTLYKTGKAKLNTSQTNKLTDGLVGMWSFDGLDMAADTVYDLSGSDNHGVLQNDPSRTIGKVGQALLFDGVDDYVEVSDGGDLAFGSEDFTLSAWVKKGKGGDTDQYPIAKGYPGTDGSQRGYGLRTEESNERFIFFIQDDSTVKSTGEWSLGMPVGEWHHLVGVVDRTQNTMKAYYDGEQFGDAVDISSVGDITSNTGLRFGQSATGRYFSGTVDEVRVYDRVLSENEIKRLYNIGR